MSEEILSDNEVDALMEKSGGDEVLFADDSAREYRLFDITDREQGTVNRMGALSAILKRHDELTHLGMLKRLNTNFEVRCQAPRVFSIAEAVASLPEGLVLVTLNLPPVSGQSFMILSINTLSYLVHRYFGGGNTKAPDVSGRSDATSSELRLSERLSDIYLQSFTEAFQDKVSFEPEVVDTQTNLDALEERAANEKYLTLVSEIATGDFEDVIRLFVPFESFEGLEAQLAGAQRNQAVSLEDEWQVRLADQMRDVPVEIAGVLATIELPLRNVLGLKVDDVIDLSPPGRVSLEVQNQAVGFGQYGVFDDKKSVKYGMEGLLDLGAGVTLSSAVDDALNEDAGNE